MTTRRDISSLSTALASVALLAASLCAPVAAQDNANQTEPRFGEVQCANLIYANDKTSVCFSDAFMAQAQRDANIRTTGKFTPVKLDSPDLFEHPFAVMTGEGAFTLTDAQRRNLLNYLSRGGFIVASAGCSSREWADSFLREIKQIAPDQPLKKLEMDHAIFRTVYDIKTLTAKQGNRPYLAGLEIDGRIVLVFTEDGLNDTGNAGPQCCCCGGNEIRNAKEVNVNLLAYALTH